MVTTRIKTFLWVVPTWPFPPEDGAAIARANLIKSLAEYGYGIDILVITNSTKTHYELPKDIPIGTIYSIKTTIEKNKFIKPFYFLLMSLIHYWTPVVMLRFSQNNIKKAVHKILMENHNWDAIVYDGLHIAAHQMFFGQYKRVNYPKVILYRAHNVESDIWYRMAEQQKNILKKFFLQTQANRVAKFEKSLIKTADAVATVSPIDYLKLKKLVPYFKSNVVPISFDFTKPLLFPKSKETIHIMFLGRLDWPPNKDGLIWFLNKVWHQVVRLRSDVHLSIAGSGNSNWMQKYSKLPHVTFLGKIQNIEQLYQKSCLLIVPVFYGSGTRVKIIEACSYGRPCLSTTVGAEGIGLEDQMSYYCADDAAGWVKCLSTMQLTELKTMGDNAFQFAKQVFDHAVARDEFIKLL